MWKGKYTLIETENPYPGYEKLPKQVATGTIEGNRKEEKITVENERIEPGNLKIIKIDEVTKEKLDGVGFTIQVKESAANPEIVGKYINLDATGKKAVYTNTAVTLKTFNGEINIEEVTPGTYEIKEVSIDNTGEGQSNYGYKLDSSENVTVVIKEGESKSETITNQSLLGSIEITKIDETTKEAMSNIGFTLQMTSGEKQGYYVGRNSNGKATYSQTPITIKTNTNGKITIDDMWEGNYVLIETENPYPGYGVLPQEVERGTIKNNREIVKVTIENKKIEPGELRIIKRDEATKEKMNGVGFTIQVKKCDTTPELEGKYVSQDAQNQAVYTDDPVTLKTVNGEIEVKNVEVGTYEIKEVSIDNTGEGQENYGYLIDSSEGIKVEMLEGQSVSKTIMNQSHLGSIEITKIDKETKEAMSNIGFTLQMTSGEKQGYYVGRNNNGKATYSQTPITIKTETSGKITIDDMWEGDYVLIETENPYPGYEKLPKQVATGTIKGNRQKEKITVENKKTEPGDLKIIKIDESTKELLDGVGFTIQVKESANNPEIVGKYVNLDSEGKKAVYTSTPVTLKTVNGEINIEEVTPGTYEIKEVSIDHAGEGQENYGYRIDSSEGVQVEMVEGKSASKTITNQFHLGSIEITKIDKETRLPLSDIGFTLQMTSGEKQGYYVGRNNDGKATYSQTPITIKTDTDGKITIDDMWDGNYVLIETENPYTGYEELPKQVATGTIKGNRQKEKITVENTRMDLGDLHIVKVGTTGEKLSGVGFTIQVKECKDVPEVQGLYVNKNAQGEAIYTSTPVTLKTVKGVIDIEELWTGTYEIKEVSIDNAEEGEENYGYKVDSSKNVTVTIERAKTTSQTISNDFLLTSMEITKIDKDTRTPMSDVEFTLQMTSGEKQGYYVGVDIQGEAVYSETPITIKTDSNGKITIEDMWEGNYVLVETENPHPSYGELPKQVATGTIQRNREKVSITVENQRVPEGKLHITKIDETTKEKLSGVGFTIQLKTCTIKPEMQGKYVNMNKDGEAVYSDTPVTLKTVNGEINIEKLWYGTYEIKETSIDNNEEGQPNYGYVVDSSKNIETVLESRETKEETITNEFQLGSLEITKIDKATKKAMSGVGFTLQMTSGQKSGYYVGINSNGTPVYSKTPLTITTDANGKITLERIWKGNYTLIETVNPYPGYDPVPKQVATGTITGNREKVFITIENEKKYIDLTGNVWEETGEGKETKPNDLMDTYENKVSGIKVTLVKKDGTKVTTQTDSVGHYEFKNLLIKDVVENQYTIEFEYNGISYESISVNTKNELGSKALDISTSRDTINNRFTTITNQNTQGIQYRTTGGESKVIFQVNNQNYDYNKKYEGDKYYSQDIYHVTASTSGVYNIGSDYDENNLEQAEIVVNYGITEREQPDLSLIKDLESTKVSIAGEEHIYKYADRFNKDLYTKYNENGKSGYDMSPQVRFASKYGSMSYSRALYASDVNYTGVDGLKVEVTYRIGISNSSENLKMRVNEIVDYYDSKYGYDFVKAGREINEDGSIKEGTELLVTKDGSVSNHQKIRIQTDLDIGTSGEECIYVQLQVLSDKIVELLGNNDQVVELDNIAEINSYTTKDSKGNPYAGIDKDSQPGNAIVGDKTTYEDDTDTAPTLKLLLQEKREITGNVFVDTTSGELKSGEIRQGEGIYKAGETTGIKGVTVKLVQPNGDIEKVYNETTKQWEDAITTTGDDGSYYIGGFIPGDYQVVYTWGDKTYKVQDYKGTVVNQTSHNAKSSNLEWYKDEFKKNYPDVEWNQSSNQEIRVSDATDNYETRQQIDAQTGTITNQMKAIMKEYNAENLITQMDSTTPIFRANIEYSSNNITNAKDEYEVDENGNLVMNGIYVVKKEGYRNEIKSIDFGIVERARQVLSLEKVIKNVKIVLANGTVLVNAELGEDGKLVGDVKHTVFVPKSEAANGQVKVEIDGEIIQGAKLEIEYGLKVRNISEIDYNNSEFYLYGKGHGENINEVVTLKANKVIDYLDNNMLTSEAGGDWQTIQTNADKLKLIQQGLLENSGAMKNLLENQDKVILTDKLAKELKPEGIGASETETEMLLTGQRLLSNNDETFLENCAEIIEIEKSGGSSIITTPGNYIPSNSETFEYDDDTSEGVVITPPTGLSTDYIAYTILAISSLGILISGIILIKKYVLRK